MKKLFLCFTVAFAFGVSTQATAKSKITAKAKAETKATAPKTVKGKQLFEKIWNGPCIDGQMDVWQGTVIFGFPVGHQTHVQTYSC